MISADKLTSCYEIGTLLRVYESSEGSEQYTIYEGRLKAFLNSPPAIILSKAYKVIYDISPITGSEKIIGKVPVGTVFIQLKHVRKIEEVEE
mgnify:CR=1 FL=1